MSIRIYHVLFAGVTFIGVLAALSTCNNEKIIKSVNYGPYFEDSTKTHSIGIVENIKKNETDIIVYDALTDSTGQRIIEIGDTAHGWFEQGPDYVRIQKNGLSELYANKESTIGKETIKEYTPLFNQRVQEVINANTSYAKQHK